MRCLACQGVGWDIRRVPSKLYDCGYFTVASVCRRCNGKKYLIPSEPS